MSCQNYQNFQNLLHVYKMQEHMSVVQVWGDNEIHELFPLHGHRDFYCQVEASYS